MSLGSTPGKECYPALTGVSAVFLDHFPLWSPGKHRFNVMAFFSVLSGFLITRLYHEQPASLGACAELHPDSRAVLSLQRDDRAHLDVDGGRVLLRPAPVFMIVARQYTFGAEPRLGWLLLAAALVISKLGIPFLQTPLFALARHPLSGRAACSGAGSRAGAVHRRHLRGDLGYRASDVSVRNR
jgi:hypothetical protein